jgi:hypothetical protein
LDRKDFHKNQSIPPTNGKNNEIKDNYLNTSNHIEKPTQTNTTDPQKTNNILQYDKLNVVDSIITPTPALYISSIPPSC